MKHQRLKAILSIILVIITTCSLISIVSYATEEVTIVVPRNNSEQTESSEETTTTKDSSTVPLVTDLAAPTYNEETEYMEAEAQLFINEKYSLESVLQLINDNLHYSTWEANVETHSLHSLPTIVASQQAEERYIKELIPKMLKENGMDGAIDESKIDVNIKKISDIKKITVKITEENGSNVSAYIESSSTFDFKTTKNSDNIIISFENSKTSLKDKLGFKEGLSLLAGEQNITVDEANNTETTTNSSSETDEENNSKHLYAIAGCFALGLFICCLIPISYALKKKRK